MKLTLYYAPMTCALVPYVTLTEAGATFDVRDLNTRTNQHRSPEFLAINPKHKVPVLVIDDEPLTENVAIQIWIARQFPRAGLLPSPPKAEIKAISLMAWFSSTIHPHLTPNARPENYCDLPGSQESVKRVGNRLLFEDFAIADGLLAGR
ncbi:MAG: glutathione S-transferase family protein, partial [Burkholderiales bacterium]